jgi:hypothetical protein
MSHMLTQRIPILGVARCGEDDGRDGGKPQKTRRWSNLRSAPALLPGVSYTKFIWLSLS